MKPSSLILDIEDFCVLKGDIVDKILLSSNADIALLYLYISRVKTNYSENTALNALNFSKERLEKAMLELLSLNIIKKPESENANNFVIKKQSYTISELKNAKKDEVFAFVCETTEKVFGKPLTEGYIKSLLYVYDSLKLPAEVIVELVSYLKNNTNTLPTKSEIEREAHIWSDLGLLTHESATAYIKSKYDEKPAIKVMAEALSIVNRNLTAKEEHYIVNFIKLGFTPEVVEFCANGIKDQYGRFSQKSLFNLLLACKEKNLFSKEQILSAYPKLGFNKKSVNNNDHSFEMELINKRRGI